MIHAEHVNIMFLHTENANVVLIIFIFEEGSITAVYNVYQKFKNHITRYNVRISWLKDKSSVKTLLASITD